MKKIMLATILLGSLFLGSALATPVDFARWTAYNDESTVVNWVQGLSDFTVKTVSFTGSLSNQVTPTGVSYTSGFEQMVITGEAKVQRTYHYVIGDVTRTLTVPIKMAVVGNGPAECWDMDSTRIYCDAGASRLVVSSYKAPELNMRADLSTFRFDIQGGKVNLAGGFFAGDDSAFRVTGIDVVTLRTR